jgi:ubiquinone/menaquinone biosynthesis C-methylase UbiE
MWEQHVTMVPKETWEREYRVIHAIPSSLREQPAKALLLFAELLNLRNKRVLDAGCGNGRNAVYLAKRDCDVTAVDFTEAALIETQRRANEKGVQSHVTVEKIDLSLPLRFSANSFDLVLDAYTFCHFLDDDLASSFWMEMNRVVRTDGRLVSIAFSVDDSYYAQYPSRNGHKIVSDPTNGISKRLYQEGELKDFFSRFFRIEYFAKFEFADIVHEKVFNRVVFTSVLRPLER